MKFLSLKELHRLPTLPQGKTSAQARYLTATTTAAQRLRAMGPPGTSARYRKCASELLLLGADICDSPMNAFQSAVGVIAAVANFRSLATKRLARFL